MSSMNAKRLVISSLILSLTISGGWLYASRDEVSAQSQAAQETKADQDAKADKAHPRKEHGLPILDEAASILGMKTEDLKAALKKDKSIVQVAKEKGISEADLSTKLIAIRSAKIDEAVKSGKLDAAKAEQIKSRMSEHLNHMLNHKGLAKDKGKHHKGKGGMYPPEQVASMLGMKKDELIAELKKGKSLAEVAQSKGISREQLIQKIKDEMTPKIERIIDHKKTKDDEKK